MRGDKNKSHVPLVPDTYKPPGTAAYRAHKNPANHKKKALQL